MKLYTPANLPGADLARFGAYVPFIDGLRAVSILAVVGFHVGLPGFSGGFIGVDVFL
jgi:peptidoglycan/LPS O-acetylase OafA/YrhL